MKQKRFDELGPNAKNFAQITYKVFDRIVDSYIEKVKDQTQMDINISYEVTFSLPQLIALDEPETKFDYKLWKKLMGWENGNGH